MLVGAKNAISWWSLPEFVKNLKAWMKSFNSSSSFLNFSELMWHHAFLVKLCLLLHFPFGHSWSNCTVHIACNASNQHLPCFSSSISCYAEILHSWSCCVVMLRQPRHTVVKSDLCCALPVMNHSVLWRGKESLSIVDIQYILDVIVQYRIHRSLIGI